MRAAWGLPALVLLVLGGAAPRPSLAQGGSYTWSISNSGTMPLVNSAGNPGSGVHTLHLWLYESCSQSSSLKSGYLQLVSSPGWTLLNVTGVNGFSFTPDSTGSFNLVATPCRAGSIRAATISVMSDGSPGRVEFDPGPGIAVDCFDLVTTGGAIRYLGFATADHPRPPQDCGNGCMGSGSTGCTACYPSASPSQGSAPLTVQFTGATSTGQGSIFLWDFGDSSAQDSRQNPQHTYLTEGTYTVGFYVASGPGVICSTTFDVVVTPPEADLAVTKVVDDSTPDEGQVITYTVAVVNGGPSPTSAVQIMDSLPPGVAFQSATPTRGMFNPLTGIWDIPFLPVGPPDTLAITALVGPGTAGSTILNTASVLASAVPDSTSGNDSATAGITVPAIDIAVQKTTLSGSPNAGDVVFYFVDVVNFGPDIATGVVVTDLLPPFLSYDASYATQGMYDSTSGVWDLGTLADSAGATLNINALVNSGTPPGTVITNTAAVTNSDQGDVDAMNDSDSVSLTVAAIDLEVVKVVDVPNPDEGDPFVYTVTVTNLGPDLATGVSVTDPLPAGVSFSMSTPSQGGYNPATGIWTVGPLANGASAALDITATVNPGTAGTTITNDAKILGSDQADTNAMNDSDSADLTVQAVDLAVTKIVDDPTPAEGGLIVYTVTLSNMGPDSATAVTVTDSLPNGITYQSHSPPGAAYNPATGSWTPLPIAPDSSRTLFITATVDAETAGATITNTAALTASNQTDTNPANDSDSVNITIVQAVDLAVTKTVDNPTPAEGGTMVYMIAVTNNGPNAADSVEVIDLLPTGVTYLSDAPSQGTYTTATGLWIVGTLASAATATLDITATVNPGTAGTVITNTAMIRASAQADMNPANDSDSADITVPAPSQATCSISADVAIGRAPLAVTFTATIAGAMSNALLWDYGDGLTDLTGIDQVTISHLYGGRGAYFATVTVLDSASSRVECTSSPVRVFVVQATSRTISVPGSDRFIALSLPLVSGAGSGALPVAGLLGALEPEDWKLGRWSAPDSAYLDAGIDFDAFEPGRSYWLFTRDPADLTVTGVTVPDRDFIVPLESGPGTAPGWNQIADPFDFPIAVSVLQVTDGARTFALADSLNNVLTEYVVLEWQSAEVGAPEVYRNATVLEPGRGYWLRRIGAGPAVRLVLPPTRAPAPVASPVFDAAPGSGSPPSGSWSVRIRATSGPAVTEEIVLGASPLARPGWDPLDLSLPPLPDRRLTLSIPQTGWGRMNGRYLRDIRPDSSPMVWRFALADGDVPAEVVLEVHTDGLPPTARLWLTDVAGDVVREIVPSEPPRFAALAAPRAFELLVDLDGTMELGTSAIPGFRYAYPNPFRSTVGFRFDVDRTTTLGVTVYDVAGRRVWSSTRSAGSPGENVLLWDGRDLHGKQVASGVYLVRHRMGNVTATDRIVRIR